MNHAFRCFGKASNAIKFDLSPFYHFYLNKEFNLNLTLII